MQSISSEAESLHQNPERANPGPTMFGLKCPFRKSVLRQKVTSDLCRLWRHFESFLKKMLRDEHFHKSFLLRAMAAYGAPIFSSRKWWSPSASRFRTPLGKRCGETVQAETSAGPILPTPGVAVAGMWQIWQTKRKGNCQLMAVKLGLFWKLVCFFWETRDPPKVTPRPQSFRQWAVIRCTPGFRIVSLHSVWKEPGSRIHIYVNCCCFFESWLDFWMKSCVQKKSTVWYPDEYLAAALHFWSSGKTAWVEMHPCGTLCNWQEKGRGPTWQVNLPKPNFGRHGTLKPWQLKQKLSCSIKTCQCWQVDLEPELVVRESTKEMVSAQGICSSGNRSRSRRNSRSRWDGRWLSMPNCDDLKLEDRKS